MSRICGWLFVVALTFASVCEASPEASASEATIHLRQYAQHMSGAGPSGSVILPLVFKVDANGKIEAMISGNALSRNSTEVLPRDDALIEALRENRFQGFREKHLKSYPEKLLSLLTSTQRNGGGVLPAANVTVLVRKGQSFKEHTGADAVVALDNAWEATLRQDHERAGGTRKLVVIRVEFP
ncbi:MAG: hypothetical protein IPK97_21115 [Ahniella sp.]|nr:hypothetical protein [Ahniella sp.]